MKSIQYMIIFGLSFWGFLLPSLAWGLSFCQTKDIGHFNPSLYTENLADKSFARLIFDRLTDFDRKTEAIIPALATDWQVNEDGTLYQFTLRGGVKFQSSRYFIPTRDLNATDVVFSFQRVMDPTHPLHNLHGDDYRNFTNSSLSDKIIAIKAIDDLTFSIELTESDSSLLSMLSQDIFSILSHEYAEQMIAEGTPEQFDKQPIGTGAYGLMAHHPGIVTNLRPFARRWHEFEVDSNMLLLPVAQEDERIQKLRLGDCDIIPAIPYEKINRLEHYNNIFILRHKRNSLLYIAYNTKWAPMDKTMVRRALSISVSKNIIAQAIFQGQASSNSSPVPPSVWGHKDDLVSYLFSPTTAREFLIEADSEDLAFDLFLPSTPSALLPDPTLLAAILRADWALAGLEVTAHFLDEDELLKVATDKNRPGAIVQIAQGQGGNIEEYLTDRLTCNAKPALNVAHWCNDLYDRIMTAVKDEKDIDVRKNYYNRAQEIFNEEVPWTPLVSHFLYVPMQDRVENFTMNSYGIYHLAGVKVR